MWQKIKPVLIALSVVLNIAFVSVWAARVLPRQLAHEVKDTTPRNCEDCTIHRELGTSESQRQQMEPRQEAYRKNTQILCLRAQELRGELIDLIAVPATDNIALAAKQDSILDIQRKMQTLVVEHLMFEKQILNPEQQRKLFSMMRQRCGCGDGVCINPNMKNSTIPR
ncbi:periplasmic heavy metal sensor [candidate division KSB1 bacterium]|nr:MAG: periplasmic heavy metal sensor [candidate division KSB1 bacterium]